MAARKMSGARPAAGAAGKRTGGRTLPGAGKVQPGVKAELGKTRARRPPDAEIPAQPRRKK